MTTLQDIIDETEILSNDDRCPELWRGEYRRILNLLVMLRDADNVSTKDLVVELQGRQGVERMITQGPNGEDIVIGFDPDHNDPFYRKVNTGHCIILRIID